MNFQQVARQMGSKLSEHAPTILTGVSVGGLIGTTVLAVRATPEALRRIWDAESELDMKTTLLEKAKLSWDLYIPAGLVGLATGLSIVGANAISTSRRAALLGAYSLTERAFKEYRDHAAEALGESKEQKVFDEIAKERVEETSDRMDKTIILGSGEVACVDVYSGRYFTSNMETIRKAANDVNALCINEFYASLNEFYRRIGLDETPHGDQVGWNTDNMMDLMFTSVLHEDRPVLAINYIHPPTDRYHHIWG